MFLFAAQDNGLILFQDDANNNMRDENILDDRSHMYFRAPLFFKRGTMRGYAWMHCTSDLDLLHPGTKYLDNGIILVYYGTAYLGHGEIITSNQVSSSRSLECVPPTTRSLMQEKTL